MRVESAQKYYVIRTSAIHTHVFWTAGFISIHILQVQSIYDRQNCGCNFVHGQAATIDEKVLNSVQELGKIAQVPLPQKALLEDTDDSVLMVSFMLYLQTQLWASTESLNTSITAAIVRKHSSVWQYPCEVTTSDYSADQCWRARLGINLLGSPHQWHRQPSLWWNETLPKRILIQTLLCKLTVRSYNCPWPSTQASRWSHVHHMHITCRPHAGHTFHSWWRPIWSKCNYKPS